MEREPIPGAIVDRLRNNLKAAGIPFADTDIEEILERDHVRMVVAFERLVAATSADVLPDYLASRSAAAGLEVAGSVGSAQPAAQTPKVSRPVPPGFSGPGEARAGRLPATIGDLADLLRAHTVSPVELTEAALAAIAVLNPTLNAFQCVLAEQALAAARVAEVEILAGDYRGPLHGVPVAVKDLLAMSGTPTTAGSKILADRVTEFDAAAVERLRQAGAVIVGKTRLAEFAYSPGSNNAQYGPVHNPWNLAHDTGGSSSGSGAAVAAGLVYGALGTDTGGSIRIPASLCGIVGLKPTYGRCSLHGCLPLSWSLDHLGPMTRSVSDASLMLEPLAGLDARDPRTRPSAPWRATACRLDGEVRRMRIGVVRDDGSGRTLGTPEALAAWQAGLQALEDQGALLTEIDVPELEALRTLNGVILVLEAAAYHQPALRERLVEYGSFPRYRLLHGYAHGPLASVQAGQLRAALRRRLDALFEQVDLISTPAMPYGAPVLDKPASTTFTAPFNVLGWPAISVPVGLTADGLPLGLQLAGKPWDETTVLRAAYAVEAYGPWHT